ncbi:MAG TPA: hypothetical protein VMV94_04845 [Phycisphaerae bacterium]|nr:hypothetical protein [Phycisphaerae bacterium]
MTRKMNRVALAVGCAVMLTCAQAALALPSYGSGCQGCHSTALGTITIVGNDTTANPAEGCGTTDVGTRPVFTVAQGGTKTLSGQISGLPSGTNYAAVLKQFEQTGVANCSSLTYTPDSTWLQRTSPAPTYYTLPLTGNWFTAPSGATSFPFSITVGASTPADYYDLVLAVAGLSGNMFYTEAHFYVQVTAAAPSNPTITLNKTTLSASAAQGSSPANATFTVSNTGGGTLNYVISVDQPWLSLSPTSGSTATATDTIAVQYSTASLAAGTYPATITVSDPSATNNPQTIAVTLTITAAPPPAPPTITLNKTTLSATAAQGSSPPNSSFTVSNTGGGTLNYSITADAAWLSVSPASGSTTGAAQSITVQYSTTSLTAGSYTATITVSDPNATDNPQTIAVTLTISGGGGGGVQPTIKLSKTSLTPSVRRGSNPRDDTFTIKNTGGGTLHYTVSVAVGGQGGGSGGGGGSSSAGQTLFTQMCARCHSAASIAGSADRITTNMGSVDSAMRGITLTAQQVADLKAYLASFSSVNSVVAGGHGEDDSGDDEGGGHQSGPWLSVSPTSGSSTGVAKIITVRYRTASLARGTYRATITVSDPNAANNPQTINVTLTIGSGQGKEVDASVSPAGIQACGVGIPLIGSGMLCALAAMRTSLPRCRGSRRKQRRGDYGSDD